MRDAQNPGVGRSHFFPLTRIVGMSHIAAMDIAEIIDKAGGVQALARALDLHHTSVIGWRQSGKVPAIRCQAVSAATGIPLHELRPDIYPAGTDAAA